MLRPLARGYLGLQQAPLHQMSQQILLPNIFQRVIAIIVVIGDHGPRRQWLAQHFRRFPRFPLSPPKQGGKIIFKSEQLILAGDTAPGLEWSLKHGGDLQWMNQLL